MCVRKQKQLVMNINERDGMAGKEITRRASCEIVTENECT